jgi:hypothetical protein
VKIAVEVVVDPDFAWRGTELIAKPDLR